MVIRGDSSSLITNQRYLRETSGVVNAVEQVAREHQAMAIMVTGIGLTLLPLWEIRNCQIYCGLMPVTDGNSHACHVTAKGS